MGKSYLSIDVGTDGITAAFAREESGKRVCDVRHAAFSSDIEPAETLQQLLTPLDFTETKTYLAFSPGFFFFRSIALPFSDPKKIVQILPFEVREQLPCPIDDYVLDFILCAHEDDGSGVLVAALAREVIKDWLTICGSIGLVPESITVCNIALCNMIAETECTDFLLLDCGDNELSFYLVRQGKIVSIRSLPFLYGDDEKLPDMVASEIRRALLVMDKYVSAEPSQLSGAYIINRSAEDKQIETIVTRGLTQEFGIDVRRRGCDENLIAQISGKNSNGTVWQQFSPAFGSGISSSCFEFMQGEFRHIKGKRGGGRKMLLFLVLLICSSFILAGFQFYEYRQLTEKAQDLREEINKVFRETKPDVKRIVNPVQQLQIINNEIRSVYSRSNVGREAGFSMLEILTELSACIPDSHDVIIIRLVAESASLRIKGETQDFNTVDNVKKLLEESPCFYSVEISSANHSDTENIVRFELKIQLARQVNTR